MDGSEDALKNNSQDKILSAVIYFNTFTNLCLCLFLLKYLQTLIIYFVLLILLFACCGYLTPRALAIDLGKEYKNSTKKDYENWPAVALRIGLVSIYRICKYTDPSCSFFSMQRSRNDDIFLPMWSFQCSQETTKTTCLLYICQAVATTNALTISNTT